MEELLLAVPLSQPKRHRAHVLPPEGLSARRHPLRPERRELPRRSLHRRDRQLLVMSPDPSFPISDENRLHLFRWFIYAARRSSTCLPLVVEHFATEKLRGAEIPEEELSTFLLQQLPIRSEAAHLSEVAWLLFCAREMKLAIPSASLERVTNLRSGVVSLLTLDFRNRGLISGSIDDTNWRSHANDEGLKSQMWLCAYEVTKKGWWAKSRSTKYIENHKFFGKLYAEDVKFYDDTRKARPRVGPSFFDLLKRSRMRTTPSSPWGGHRDYS